MAGTPQELVNKGGLTEMVAGLEILRYKPCIQRQKMFYWEKKGNSVAEIDYLEIHDMQIMPIEIKSGSKRLRVYTIVAFSFVRTFAP